MGAGFLLLMTAAAAQQNPVTASEKAIMGSVWNALNADPGLIKHHRGFLAYVTSHPELAKALEASGPLERHPVLRGLTAGFHDSLEQDEQAQQLFEKFYAALAADEQLRRGVDALYRVELSAGLRSLTSALIKLNGDPDTALRFLSNPAKSAPAGFHAFRMAFKKDAGLRDELSHALTALHEMPAAHSAVFPWWRRMSESNDAVSRSWLDLMAELAKQPHRFWVWHTAQIELAKDIPAWRWIRYWQRRVQRDPVLSVRYHAYLDIIGRWPDYAKAAADAWQEQLGPAPQWPPESAPPKPPAAPPRRSPFKVEMPSRPEVQKPVPHMPDMPRMPAMPVKPDKPDFKPSANASVQSLHTR